MHIYNLKVPIDFYHTLKFKKWIGSMTAMVAYDIIIPGYAILFIVCVIYYMIIMMLRLFVYCYDFKLGTKIKLNEKYGIRPWFMATIGCIFVLQ